MKKNTNPGLWITLAVILIVLVLPVSPTVRSVLLLLFLGGFIFYKRSVIYYILANRKVTKEDAESHAKAWPLYRKAIKAGLQPNFVITAASMFLQRGDIKEGKEVIETYLANAKNKDSNLINIAKTMVSMAYWMEGDLDKAIATVEEVYETGYRDKNLYINYGTYVLEKGDTELAQRLLEESGELKTSSPGIIDNQGWIYLLRGEWETADTLYQDLVSRGPKFPEPYVHAAQVKIHYGLLDEAIALLQKALDARYSNTSGMKRDFVEQLFTWLEDPQTRIQAAHLIDRKTSEVAKGSHFELTGKAYPPDENGLLQGFAKAPKKTAAKKAAPKEERAPNTELTTEDLEYAKKYEQS